MKKAALITGAALALLLVASMGAFAFGGYGQDGAMPSGVERGTYRDQMAEILESGTYEDLEALRAETGMPMNPRIQSQDDFVAWQARHAEIMAEYGEGPHFGEHGPRDGTGNRRGQGRGAGRMNGGMNGNCPMMS